MSNTIKKINHPNYFKLKNLFSKTEIYGILTDTPSFSMSTKLEDGPGVAVGEFVKQFACSDTFEIVGFISSAKEYKNLAPEGSLTRKIYTGYEYPQIPLKFRAYSDSQVTAPEFNHSSIEKIIKFLINNAYLHNPLSLTDGLDNIKPVAQASKDYGNRLVEAISLESDKREMTEEELKEIQEKFKNEISTIRVKSSVPRSDTINTFSYNPETVGDDLIEVAGSSGMARPFLKFDKKNLTFTTLKMIAGGPMAEQDVPRCRNAVNDLLEKIKMEVLDGNESETSKLGEILNAVDLVTGEIYGIKRTYNDVTKKNILGSPVLELTILEQFFKKPLKVIITGWDVEFSKEIGSNSGTPMYVDFTINCQMDQIYPYTNTSSMGANADFWDEILV